MSESYEVTMLKVAIREMQHEIDLLRSRLDSLTEHVCVGPTGNHSWRIEPPPSKADV